MRPVYTTNRFKKDYKLAAKRGKNMRKMDEIAEWLAAGIALPARCRPHKLFGDYEDQWECHVEPDWLLIYFFRNEALWLNRLGTHADLFE